MSNTTTKPTKPDRPAYMAEYITQSDLKAALNEQTTELATIISDMGQRIFEYIQPIERDVSELKSDVKVLKSDVSELKTDVGVLKTDVKELKSDMRTNTKSLMRLKLVNSGILEYLVDDKKKRNEILEDI